MIQFNYIKIKGFGSIDELEFEFNNQGIHVIKGKNGAGKTSIFAALYWALYGETIKEKASVERWAHLRTEDYKGVMVEVELEKNGEIHHIARFSNYKGKYDGAKGGSRLVLSSSDSSYKRDVQKDINELLGINSELFKSSILFGQKMKRIIEDSGANKKKILEQCFDTSTLDSLVTNIKTDIDKLRPTLSDAILKEQEILSKIEDNNNKIKLIDQDNRRKIEVYEANKKGLEDRLSDLEPSIKKYNERRKESKELTQKLEAVDIEELGKQYTDRKKKIIEANKNIQEQRIEQRKLGEEIESLDKEPICKTCGQEIKDIPTKKIKQLKKKLQKNEKPLSDLILSTRKLEEQQKELGKEIDNYDDLELRLETINQLIDDSEPNKVKKELQEKLDNLKRPERIPVTSLQIDNGQLQELLEPKINPVKKLQKELTFLEWTLKDPLSNKGIKAYMFELLLDDINEHLIKYSTILGYRVEFEVNHDRANKDIMLSVFDERDNCIPYVDLSGGQGQLVNVATALAFHDLVIANIPFNILILDEVFESLDSDNIEKVNSLLEVKSDETSIIIITHQESFNPRNAEITQLRLAEGLTGVV